LKRRISPLVGGVPGMRTVFYGTRLLLGAVFNWRVLSLIIASLARRNPCLAFRTSIPGAPCCW
jgi:hypothetical protein